MEQDNEHRYPAGEDPFYDLLKENGKRLQQYLNTGGLDETYRVFSRSTEIPDDRPGGELLVFDLRDLEETLDPDRAAAQVRAELDYDRTVDRYTERLREGYTHLRSPLDHFLDEKWETDI